MNGISGLKKETQPVSRRKDDQARFAGSGQAQEPGLLTGTGW